MTRLIRILAVAIFAAPVQAETQPGPPEWNDRASVYLMKEQRTTELPEQAEHAAADVTVAEKVTTPAAPPVVDTAVTPAVHAAPAATQATELVGRQLPPPSARLSMGQGDGAAQSEPGHDATRSLSQFGLPMQSLYTMGCALAIVVGAFLLFAWALRRGGRAGSRRGSSLPTDVVSVLGRVPLAARQYAELLRVGNKLVLVSFTATGIETITEVTDPTEVDRLVGLCQQNAPFSTTKAFEQVFQQMSKDAAPTGFLGSDVLPPSSFTSPAGAYRANRGGGRA